MKDLADHRFKEFNAAPADELAVQAPIVGYWRLNHEAEEMLLSKKSFRFNGF